MKKKFKLYLLFYTWTVCLLFSVAYNYLAIVVYKEPPINWTLALVMLVGFILTLFTGTKLIVRAAQKDIADDALNNK